MFASGSEAGTIMIDIGMSTAVLVTEEWCTKAAGMVREAECQGPVTTAMAGGVCYIVDQNERAEFCDARKCCRQFAGYYYGGLAKVNSLTKLEEITSILTLNPERVTRDLLQKHTDNVLERWWPLLAGHMSKWAPVILAPEPGEPSVKDDGTIERALDQVLLRPIIALLAANEKASTLAHLQAVLQNPGVPLENLDSFQPSEGPAMAGNICGHVFKSGEPTYSCRECAVDGTCVLCYKCFEKSAHRKHKYRMHTSSGGTGYCDCGDAEAWKAHVHCELHAQNAPAPSSADSVSTETAATAFDDVTLKRLKSIISQLLNYSLACLLTDLTEDLPADLNLEPCQECEGQFFCILYNDETHTYDGVIRALKSAVGCSEERAMLLATVVDREGRSLVKNDTKTACNSVRQEIERKTARDSNERTGRRGPLLAKVMKAELVAHQTTAIRLHQVLAQAAALHGSMQKVLAECLLEKPELTMEPVAKMLRYDHSLWKAARSANNQIILSALLIAPQTKAHFARIFTEDWNHARDNKHLATQCATPQHYAACVRHFVLDDDHEHNASALALSVQIYTVPSIAKQLVASPMSALQTILKVLNDITHVFVSTETGKFDFSQRTYPARLRRAVYAMTDLK